MTLSLLIKGLIIIWFIAVDVITIKVMFEHNNPKARKEKNID